MSCNVLTQSFLVPQNVGGAEHLFKGLSLDPYFAAYIRERLHFFPDLRRAAQDCCHFRLDVFTALSAIEPHWQLTLSSLHVVRPDTQKDLRSCSVLSIRPLGDGCSGIAQHVGGVFQVEVLVTLRQHLLGQVDAATKADILENCARQPNQPQPAGEVAAERVPPECVPILRYATTVDSRDAGALMGSQAVQRSVNHPGW
jgi:hypothetical protein